MAQSDQLIRPSSSATPAAPPTSHSFAEVDPPGSDDASPRASSHSHCANPPTATEPEPASVRGASSRDQTNGNGSPASTSAAASLLPPEGFAGLFFVAASGGKGLPLELFLNVMRHVRDESQAALIQAGQVCSTWRRATHHSCELWTSLGTVRLGAEADMQRLREIASRAEGCLRGVELACDPDELDDSAAALMAIKEAFREISKRDGARRIRGLKVDLSLLGTLNDTEMALACLVHAVNFAELAAVRLRHLEVRTQEDRFPVGMPIFGALPDLDELVVTSSPHAVPGNRPPDFFQQVSTTKSVAPVECCNLYGLLRNASNTLQKLWLFDVRADPASRHLTAASSAAGEKDWPLKLELPALSDLRVAGAQTPSLWVHPLPTSSGFSIAAPAVQKICLSWQLSLFSLPDDPYDPGRISPAAPLDEKALSTLFRDTPKLEKLNLTGCTLPFGTLVAALRSASPALTTLCVGGTEAATNELIDRLDALVPTLRWLDVFSESWSRRALSDWVGNFQLTLVTCEPTDEGPATSLRNQVGIALLALSPAQVSYIPSQLTVDSPPDGPTHESIAQELLEFSGLRARQAGPVEKNGAPQAPPPRPAGIPAAFANACALVQRWVRTREDETAVEYFARAQKEHPGFSEWHVPSIEL
ncbi:hypothetical protein JCM8202v2_005498 [Rhodotorula sphaerocarpa]